jgi:hypothetical protein
MKDFQYADYNDLCGCVAVISQYNIRNASVLKSLIINMKGERIVMANCPKCNGTGIKEDDHEE